MIYTLNTALAQEEGNKQLYPALQADNYQPKLKDKVSISMSEESFMHS